LGTSTLCISLASQTAVTSEQAGDRCGRLRNESAVALLILSKIVECYLQAPAVRCWSGSHDASRPLVPSDPIKTLAQHSTTSAPSARSRLTCKRGVSLPSCGSS